MIKTIANTIADRALGMAYIGTLAALLLAQCSYCLVMQSLGGGLNAKAFLLWFFSNPLPLVTAAGVASLFHRKTILLLALGATTALLVTLADLAAFPLEEWSFFNVLKRAQNKLPVVAIYVALGASLYLFKQRTREQSPSPTAIPACCDDADAIKGAGNYVEVISGDRRSLERQTLTKAERLLARTGYIRTHRSWIVRLGAIQDIRRDREGLASLVLKSGIEVPVGRTYRPDVLNALNN